MSARSKARPHALKALGACLLAALTGCGDGQDAVPVAELLGADDESVTGFAQAERGYEITLPADHGPHPAFRSEWWYLTVALQDDSGADLGVQFTVFRQALQPDQNAAPEPCQWCSNQAWLAHVALTDSRSGKHLHAERFSRGVGALAGARAEPFAVWLEDWRLASMGAAFEPLRLVAWTEEFAINLTLSGGDLMLQGEAGYSPKGPGQASHYFSVPRLAARGTIELDGQRSVVTGRGWLDREWSTSVLSSGQRGWDWLSLQLDDGRDLMAFRLRRDDNVRDPFDQAILRQPDGAVRRFAADEFTLRPLRFWTDEHGDTWPTAFELVLGEEVLTVEAAIDDQLMRTLVRYWEGLIIARSASGERVGTGYLELTGYGDGDTQASRGVGSRN